MLLWRYFRLPKVPKGVGRKFFKGGGGGGTGRKAKGGDTPLPSAAEAHEGTPLFWQIMRF